jgi:tyrosine-protein phosphatase YwqE
MFEDMDGFKINSNKSEVMLVLEDSIKQEQYAEVLNWQLGCWPIKYLGAHVSRYRIMIRNLKFIAEMILKHLDG